MKQYFISVANSSGRYMGWIAASEITIEEVSRIIADRGMKYKILEVTIPDPNDHLFVDIDYSIQYVEPNAG